MAARTEAKNEAAREALEPLDDGERPLVVTIAAVVSALVAISSVVGYAAGVEVTRIGSDGIEQGEHAAPILSVIAAVGLMGTMAYGHVAGALLGRAGLPGPARDRARRRLARARAGDRGLAGDRHLGADRRGRARCSTS